MDCPGSKGRDEVISPAWRHAQKVKVMHAHIVKESKSAGSTNRKEFRMSKVRGCLGGFGGGW